MKPITSIPAVIQREREQFALPGNAKLQRNIPCRRVLAYRTIYDVLPAADKLEFEEFMFQYSIGNFDRNSLDEEDERTRKFDRWVTECIDINTNAMEARILKKRGLGFLENASAAEAFRWVGSVAPEFGAVLHQKRAGQQSSYLLHSDRKNIRLVVRWEHRELPVMLWGEIADANGEVFVYVPLYLSLSCWRMEWDQCSGLTEEMAKTVVGLVCDGARRVAEILSR